VDESRTRQPLGAFNPLLGKERRTSQLRGARWLIRVFYGTLVLSLGLAAMSLYGGVEHEDLLRYVAVVLVCLQMAVVALVAPSLTSSVISSEVETGTFELLRLTRLSAGQIFWGKLLPALLPALLPVVALLPAYTAICFINPSYIQGVVSLLPVVGLAVVFCCTLGLTCSALFLNSARATVAVYVIVAIIFVVPLLLWLSGGAVIDPIVASRACLPSPLVLSLHLLPPDGDSRIRSLAPHHLVVMTGLCLGMLVLTRVRLAQLIREG
jgi:hypothetical protein